MPALIIQFDVLLYEAQQNYFISFDENQSNFPGRLSIKLYKI